MESMLSRRGFLTSCGVCSGAMFVPDTLNAATGPIRTAGLISASQQMIQYDMRGFTRLEEARIGAAIQVLVNRFTGAHIMRNTDAVAGGAFHFSNKAWTKSNMHRQNLYGQNEFLAYQMDSLRGLQVLPKLSIRGFVRNNNVAGNAPLNRVRVKMTGQAGTRYTYQVHGSFTINLNRFHFARTGNNSEEWALVIAHEMLHNLGHMHDKNDYRPHQQIIAFERSLYYNGRYRLNQPCPSAFCM